MKEAKRFFSLKISKSKPAYKAIGINEIKEYLGKNIKKDELVDKISNNLLSSSIPSSDKLFLIDFLSSEISFI